MHRRKIESLPILPEGRHTKTPTTARLLEMFSDFSCYTYESGGEQVEFIPQLSPLQKHLLNLLEVDPTIYLLNEVHPSDAEMAISEAHSDSSD